MRIYIKDYKDKKRPYILRKDLHYKSKRYKKTITVFANDADRSDGATGAYDINSKSWWVHDKLCKTELFNDGSKCSNWQASNVLRDILREENRWFRANTWFIATFLGREIEAGYNKVKSIF